MSFQAIALVAPGVRAGRSPRRVWFAGLASATIWALLAILMYILPERTAGFAPPRYVLETNVFIGFLSVLMFSLAIMDRVPYLDTLVAPVMKRMRRAGPWLVVLAVFVTIWELVTGKFGLLPAPFFFPPNGLVEAYATDWQRLADSVLNSSILLALGFFYGSASGFLTGIAIGLSDRMGYWVHPILRFLGPVPSTALLPRAFFFFPSSFSAAIFLIALATWFPVTVLTWSGTTSIDKAYYDVARTMGAKPAFLILHVTIPAALPHVFVGLFMGLGVSFSVLVVAEMMGVKSGLGWYLQWAQGWAAYSNMYAALIVMAVLFSSLITLLFKIRDRFLSWQSASVKW